MPPPAADAARPLAGLRVLDLSRLLPGPFATMVLGDLGAQVDKLEDPGAGDYLRSMPPLAGDVNAVFDFLNRGKRSLVLDLKHPEGRRAMLRLVARYDVVVEGFRPGTLERLGLGADVLMAENPRLVLCAISGYGADGPMAGRAGHDLNYLAHAGVLGVTGPLEGPPQSSGAQLADVGGALWAVVRILAALSARGHGGPGQRLDISMSDGAMPFAAYALTACFAGATEPRGGGVLSGGLAVYRSYRTQDGGYVSLAALEPKFWMAFAAEVGIEADMAALIPGPHQGTLIRTLSDIFGGRTRAAWAEVAARVDCCLTPVLEPGDLAIDPQHAARRTFVAGAGGLPQPRCLRPLAEDAAPPAPSQGEHTDAVLCDAGFDAPEIAALRSHGAAR